MNDRFYDLIQGFGELVGADLHPEQNQACALILNETLSLQIEYDATQDTLLLFSFIAELPPGTFRENILKDCLKVNFLAEEKEGFFSYIANENTLVLSKTLSLQTTTKERLYEHILALGERIKLWHDAIESGLSSPAGEVPQSSKTKGSIFGFNTLPRK